MKILTYSKCTKEVPLTIKNLDESFFYLADCQVNIPNFNDKETLEDYLDNCEIEFSKEEIKQLPKLFNDWLKENPDIIKGIKIRHKLFKSIKPLIDKYGEDDIWNEFENLKRLNY